ncbi:precorrin-6y C5,15-methyltransferase (decarboxylating) subunit CbiE [Candidatus Atelocyanobacterium thalassae]|uniref:Cobalamin biosynthesis bifunctional protein CbiET n=1 Tax=cyanobacterium endosymbiont of Braarudosphaera bigelowii TaxID=1285375 RepID=A0ABM7U603_9CHRO|nr:precorrin-6y C5,15-methyltransferase (decarboxylating) subunit CbiE [Candidatus Atelocyanobacterium thalassa]BDA40176.1 cobalamin biosynthesis bifunctional protein CbiET [cyanobacterium endosymbiont of Braarudosphaera bigelowii]
MIRVVGIGLNGKDSLTTEVKSIVINTSILIGSQRHLKYFSDYSGTTIALENFIKDIKVLKKLSKDNKSIVVLVSGDPLFFGLGRLLLQEINKKDLEFYPNLTSIQLAFSYIKVPWHDAQLISIHGRNLDELILSFKKGKQKIAILTDNYNSPQIIASIYLSLSLLKSYDVWVCENLGRVDQKINCFSPQKLADLKQYEFSSLNIVIFLENNNIALNTQEYAQLPVLGIRDEHFLTFKDRPGLMTKREVRIAILGELSLQPKQVIWDIGAGTGSVSIEISRLSNTSKVYAIEKTAVGINIITKNCKRFRTYNVVPFALTNLQELYELPSPDRIFIGGSGGKLIEILEICQQKLKENGIITISLATVENLGMSINWLKNNSWNYTLLSIQLSRSLAIANLTRLYPINPVFLLRANRR